MRRRKSIGGRRKHQSFTESDQGAKKNHLVPHNMTVIFKYKYDTNESSVWFFIYATSACAALDNLLS